MNAARRRRLERNATQRTHTVHLNIVSLIDVFAVLVFFLLVNASLAAARLNVIALELPVADTPAARSEEGPGLSVTLRGDGLIVSDRSGTLHHIARTPHGHDLARLSEILVQAKQAAPQSRSLTLLLEPDTAYDDLVQVMDAARLTPLAARTTGLPRELFPQIALGDADAAGAPP